MLMLATCAAPSYAQTREVSGTVTDQESGAGLPGVAVQVQGAQGGTQTDIDGNYTLAVPPGEVTLTFSLIGYVTMTAPLSGDRLDIQLAADVQSLDEVVVVGYGTVRKKDLTGAVAVVDNEQLNRRGALNPVEAMQGQVAGVDISNSSGRAGAGFDIRIRGQQSIQGGRDPLYVVDGVITDGIEFLNPQDIARVDILKDASSAAIYGSRGAYGVVLVTTKQGADVNRKAVISYDGYMGVRNVARMPEFMSGDKWMNWRQDAYISEAITRGNPVPEAPGFNTQSDEMQRRLDENDFTDWPSLVTQNGSQANHWVSLSGMSNNTGYTFGVGYQQEEGNVINEKYQRYNFKASIDQQLNEKWSGGINLNLALADYEAGAPNAMVNAFRMNPLMSPYNTEDGELIVQPGKDLVDGTSSNYHINFTSSVNPLVDMANASQETRTYYAIGNVFLQYVPLEGLSLKTTFSPRYKLDKYGQFLGTDSEGRVGGQPGGEIENTESFSYIWDNQVTYNKTAGEHSFNAMGLVSMNMFRDEVSFMSQDRMDMSAKSYHNVGSGGDLTTLQVDGDYARETILSFALRLNYSYMDKYLLTVSNRWDGASVLADGNKWESFPSAALGWKLSEEAFLENAGFIDDMKLRLSYGFTGNKVIGPYETQARASTPTYYDFGGTPMGGIRPTGIANRHLTWERTGELNAGLDFSFFKYRLSGSVDVYNKVSKKLILSRQLPFEAGYGVIPQNIGEVVNKGVEVGLTSVNISTPDLTWSTSINFARNNNEVTALYEDTDEIFQELGDGYDADDIVRVGFPLNSYYNWAADGVWQAAEAEEAAAFGQSEGQGRVRDLNGDGSITEADKTIIGTKMPDWTGGLSTTLTFKAFDLSVALIARQGMFVYSPFHAEFTNHEDRGRSKLDIDWYMQENPVTSARTSGMYPQPKNAGIYWKDSRVGYYRDASFLKVKNITLGYNFPSDMLERAGIGSLRVYANVLNPFVFTEYDGFDPEWADASLSSGGVSFVTYQVGVNLKF
ncbi:TonB-linked SusC/RagA family outer membrane protein [Anseongella ginsenosidimutans]|uniref:TonB-linked SusC/RagA family outer membrane protein n=3 Tax=Anseongella ginsenosidimutans TaxID=496056 RepID=A0A4R3KMB5_9SPHI|nr:TonB-linked SusC/RagA family outer membrane protein [Anseongella ginsenosidimutans]